MESAVDVLAGRRVPASHGRQGRTYECARCRAPVHLRAGRLRKVHFAHNPGVGDPECELFADSAGEGAPHPAYAAPSSPLQLCIAEDGTWQLFVEISPIELSEWGGTGLGRFDRSSVVINGNPESASEPRSASDLWPGAGRNAVTVAPTSERSGLRSNSAWPDRVERRRWHRELPPLSAGGTLFARYRGGNFRNYDPQTTPLYWGDTVVLVSATVPKSVAGSRMRRLETRHTEASDWYAWELILPACDDVRTRKWLAGFGASVEARNERPRLLSLPVGYAADDVPRFAVGSVVAVDSGAGWCEIHLHHRNWPYVAEPLAGPGMTGLRSEGPIDSVMLRSGAQRYVEYQIAYADRAEVHYWLVRCGEHVVRPFGSVSLGAAPQDLEFDIAPNVAGPYFDVELDDGREIHRTVSVDPGAAKSWILERISMARQVRIDAGNLGSLEIRIGAGRQSPPDPSSSPRNAHSSSWFGAYKFATSGQDLSGLPHWHYRGIRSGVSGIMPRGIDRGE